MVLLLALSVFPAAASIPTLSSGDCESAGVNCGGEDGAEEIKAFLLRAINGFLGLVGIIALIMVIYGGVKYIISMGDEKQAETAKHIILYALIGLIVIGLAAVLVNFVVGIINGGAGGAAGGGGAGGGGE